MGLGDLAVVVLHEVSACTVEDAGPAGAQSRGVFPAGEAESRRFDADQTHALDVDVWIEETDGVRAAAHAGDDRVGLTADLLQHLHLRLLSDDGLEVSHHHRIGMRTRHRTDDVEGTLDVGDPVAHRFVERVLERLGPTFHRHHRGTKELHPVDVRRLTLHVLGTHVDHALHTVAGGDGGARDPMLAGARLGDNPLLSHAAREQSLADGVVDLVCTGMVEVLALQVDLRATELL